MSFESDVMEMFPELVKEMRDDSCVSIGSVMTYCLDKQKVKEAIKKIRDSNWEEYLEVLAISEKRRQKVVIYATLDKLEKELGL